MAEGETVATNSAGNGRDLTKVQSILGGVIAGFAAVLSFVGIRANEISNILRNQEPLIGFVAFAFLLSILAAVLAILQPDPRHGEWPTKGFTCVTLLLIASLGGFVTVIIQLPLVTTPLQVELGIGVGVVLAAAALALLGIGWRPVTKAEWETAARAAGQGHRWVRLRVWVREDFDRQQYFVLTSILLLAIAAYSALRIESTSQSTPFAQVTATLTVAGGSPGTDVLALSVSSQKVPVADRVEITVRGLPRTVNITTLCPPKMKIGPDAFPCPVDPCSHTYCKTLIGWMLPPDQMGSVSEKLVVPFSAALYQRLEVLDQLCEPTRAKGFCTAVALVGSNLELQVPSPSVSVTSTAPRH
jgi:hypothetical protein